MIEQKIFPLWSKSWVGIPIHREWVTGLKKGGRGRKKGKKAELARSSSMKNQKREKEGQSPSVGARAQGRTTPKTVSNHTHHEERREKLPSPPKPRKLPRAPLKPNPDFSWIGKYLANPYVNLLHSSLPTQSPARLSYNPYLISPILEVKKWPHSPLYYKNLVSMLQWFIQTTNLNGMGQGLRV